MQPWWQPEGVLRRYVTDLVAGEMARLRRGLATRALPWSDGLDLVADLGADSLELMQLGSALVEALHLHESGIEDYLLARRTLGDWVAIAGAGLAHFSARLTFHTSGSSGTPKPCTHALATLRQETRHLAPLFPGARRILCAVPSHHIYGFLFSVLLPQDLGLDAQEDVLDLRASSPAWLARGARAGDLVIAHPDWWQAVVRAVPALPRGVTGVSSTAPCPDSVSEALEAAGLERLLQVYGASETAGIGARASHRDAYELFPHWRFDPANPRWLLRRMPPEEATPAGGEQAYAVQDGLQREGERRFRVGARHDDGVQVGGINVFPSRVREVLRRHPGVADAAVRLMRPEEGARLKAYVVPRGAAQDQELLAQLLEWTERHLSAPERPRAIRIGAQLPIGTAGKLADWSLQD